MFRKRVLITGAAGFLGSHLARYHLDMGDVVHGIDNFSSSQRGSKHLHELLKRNRFDFHEFDITTAVDHSDPYEWPGMIQIVAEGLNRKHDPYDIIYNFACPASPPIYQHIPIETMLTCTLGMYHVLEGARQGGNNPVIVHASTSEVYGDPEFSPQMEDYVGRVHSWGPRACYDEGKRAAEALCFDYRNKHGMDVRLVRIFNTYGPHMDPDDGRVVTNFIKQALLDKDITVYGDGSQTRSFCYVDDLIAGITTLGSLHRDLAPNHPINLGNPGEFTILELALKVLEQIPDSKSKIDYRQLPTHDPLQRRPDITLAQKYLDGWTPYVSLDEGLSRTIPYMRELVKKRA